jgi:hypothetical protein
MMDLHVDVWTYVAKSSITDLIVACYMDCVICWAPWQPGYFQILMRDALTTESNVAVVSIGTTYKRVK